MSCKKCNSITTVILRKKDLYCDQCFMTNTNHKFRACIGKSKVLSPNENVLLCISGGMGSTVMLDLISYSLSLDSNKKLRIQPSFLHIYDDHNKSMAQSVLCQCKKYNVDIYIVHISEYMSSKIQLPTMNNIYEVQSDTAAQFNDMLKSMPPTAANDFVRKIRKTLYIKYAKILGCKTVFTAETANTLAKLIICNLAAGRGEQIQSDTGFMDNFDENVKIIRPMKDISMEELEYYVRIKHLEATPGNTIQNNSLQALVSCFVNDLQENFQSTISTVCKTADKIGDQDKIVTGEHCLICECPINFKKLQLSALEATNISSAISLNNAKENPTINLNTSDYLDILKNNGHDTLIHYHLCYGCNRNYSEMNQPKLPQYIVDKMQT